MHTCYFKNVHFSPRSHKNALLHSYDCHHNFVSFLPLYSFTYVEVLFKAAKVLTCERPSPRDLPNRRREIEKLPNQKSQFYTFSFNELLYLTPQLFYPQTF